MSNKIKINHITYIGKSTLNLSSDECAICKENLCDKCIKCMNNIDCNDNMCVSVVGICNHAFHYCCITKYISGVSLAAQKCPICYQKWELKKRKDIKANNINDIKINNISNIKEVPIYDSEIYKSDSDIE